MDSYTGLVGEAGLSGMVGGSSYTAARTRGDGTCGLHALFGTCVGGELYAASVRSRLQQLLPKDLGTVLANASVNGRRALGEALEQLLRDVMPIGRKIVEGVELQDKSLLLWRALPAHVREDVLALATMKQHERAIDAQQLEQLKKLFREIFIPAHAVSVVRILCVLLDYLLPSAPLQLLSMPPETPELQRHEGQRGSLEVLHACSENLSLTKYQALFNPDVLYDRYRIAFFMNAANQHAEQDWLLDALDSTSQLLADSNPEGEALLVSARTLLARRYTCYGCIAQPPSCTREVAWSTLLDLFLQEDYYFSVAEIMVPAIVLDFSLSVYRYNATAPDNDVMELLAQYTAVNTDAGACLVLDIKEGDEKMRGHFLRLYPESAWEVHEELHGSGEVFFSDTSLSSDDSTASDSADDSGAHDMEVAPEKVPMLEDQPMEDDAEHDLDSLSSVSDDSDIFHVEAHPDPPFTTLEDEELERIQKLVPFLRDYPLLPPQASDPQQSFKDLHSGQRLPALHCGFKGSTGQLLSAT